MYDCEYAEVSRDNDGHVDEAFCRLDHLSCGACEDYTPFIRPVVDAVFDEDDVGPPF